jgi:hypothetical protein
MTRLLIAVTIALSGIVMTPAAQEFTEGQDTPAYSDGDQLLIESLSQRLQAANVACPAQTEVQEYRTFRARVGAHVEAAYPGYTIGADFALVPVVVVEEPVAEVLEGDQP